MNPVTLVVLGSIALGASCKRENTPPSNPEAPPGRAKDIETKILEKGAQALQDLSPIRGIDHYLDGFHVMKDDPSLHMEAHHFCKGMNEEFTQCVIFDGNTKDANIIGLEYIVSEQLFATLGASEKKSWHPHNYEILSGQLVMPNVPAAAEKAALRRKINSYGKTWHVWDTGHAGHPAADKLPIGRPRLAWSYNRDGEVPVALVQERDKRMQIDTETIRAQRGDLAAGAKPQMGVDDMLGKLGSKRPADVVKP